MGFVYFYLFVKWIVEVKFFKNVFIVRIDRYLILFCINNVVDDFVIGVRRVL